MQNRSAWRLCGEILQIPLLNRGSTGVADPLTVLSGAPVGTSREGVAARVPVPSRYSNRACNLPVFQARPGRPSISFEWPALSARPLQIGRCGWLETAATAFRRRRVSASSRKRRRGRRSGICPAPGFPRWARPGFVFPPARKKSSPHCRAAATARDGAPTVKSVSAPARKDCDGHCTDGAARERHAAVQANRAVDNPARAGARPDSTRAVGPAVEIG